jgi:PEP-CTERM motif
MNQVLRGASLATGVAALALSLSAGAVTVSLVQDGADGLDVVISGLGTSPANIVSAFDVGMNFAGNTLAASGMSLNTAVLDDGSGFSYGSCAMGSDGSTAVGGFGGCPGSIPGGVTADLSYVSLLDDTTLEGIENPGHAANFSLTLATLTFSGAVAPTDVTLVWGDGIHDVKGAAQCPGPNPAGGPGVACVIFNGNPSVPEPGTLALLGFGVLAGAATLRRRRSR